MFMIDLILHLLFVVCSLVQLVQTNSAVQVPVFRVEPERIFNDAPHIQRLLLYEDSLFIAARNKLFKVSASNIEASFISRDLSCGKKAEPCITNVGAILKSRNGKIIVCGSYGEYGNTIDYFRSSDLFMLESTAKGVCSKNLDRPSHSVFVDDDHVVNSKGAFFVASPDAQQKSVISKTEHGNPEFLYSKKEHFFDADATTFHGTFEHGEYVYFFIRELASQDKCLGTKKYFSSVLRVCKSDKPEIYYNDGNSNNAWNSMLKLQLLCTARRTYQLPKYPGQDESISFDELEFVRSESFGGETYFFTTFSNSLVDSYESAFCVYSKHDIDNMMDSAKFVVSNADENDPNRADAPNHLGRSCNILKVSDKSSIQSDRSFSERLEYSSKHVKLDEQLPSESLLRIQGVRFVNLVVDSVQKSDYRFNVIYATTENGSIYKAVQWNSRNNEPAQAYLVSVNKLQSKEFVRAIELLPTRFLYIAQSSRVSQIALQQCEHYQQCTFCTRDPDCRWHANTRACLIADDSQTSGFAHFNLNNPELGSSECEAAQVSAAVSAKTKSLFRGDSYYLGCRNPGGGDTTWQHDGEDVVSHTSQLLTVDGGLVLMNITISDAGKYECRSKTHLLELYQIEIDDVNCQKPSTAEEYRAVYQEWCREFAEYKKSMAKWTKEFSAQCNRADNNVKKLEANSGQNMARHKR